ncbi:MAG: thermonuclease family protein [Phycisphaerae bacterium]|nr:thermonuclease family protein [Phycisphaerae bacterium]
MERVLDGDTLCVRSGHLHFLVRLHGVDAPELSQPGGREARRFIHRLLHNQDVVLIPKGVDGFGRTVADVLVNGDNLAYMLVRLGLAQWHSCFAPDDRILRRLHIQARHDRIGLWAERPMTAPSCPHTASADPPVPRFLHTCKRVR